jgi:hypothetical protein
LNIHPPIAYLVVTLMLSFMAASIKKSQIIDFFGEKILKDADERRATLLLVALSFILAPFFLSFVLISTFDKWLLRFQEREKTLTLLVASALVGSIIAPFGNLNNVFVTIALGNGSPNLSIYAFISIMLPLWISGLVILLSLSYFLCGKNKIKETSSNTQWRKKELIFSLVLFIFIFGYFNVGKHYNLNLFGLIILGGVFAIAFMGIEPLKAVNWWFLIPVGVSFVIYYLCRLFPLPDLKLSPLVVYSIGSVGSAGLSSNVLSFVLSLLKYDTSLILYSVSVGGLAGMLGSYESILIWKKGRIRIKWNLMFKIFAIFLLVSLIILFKRGGLYG